jgi:hypothetical protein
MSDDDDLRFGDISSGGAGGDSGGGFNPNPLLIGGLVAAILVFTQPLSSLIMNVGVALFVIIAGVAGSFGL